MLFFQTGTRRFISSMTQPQAASDSARCAEPAAIATEASPTRSFPTRCAIATRAGQRRSASAAMRASSFSAKGAKQS